MCKKCATHFPKSGHIKIEFSKINFTQFKDAVGKALDVDCLKNLKQKCKM